MKLKIRFSKKEHVDSGLALLLLTLLIGLWINPADALRLAIAEVLLILIAPVLIYPFTFFWLNLSDILGRVMSKVLLTVIFIVVVCPVALIRKALAKDTLQLKKFKTNAGSVFTDRNHQFTKTDFTTSY
jgi:uncharacterized membrane protein